MPFYRTRVTLHRPYTEATPMGVTKVIVEAETEASDEQAARDLARENACRVEVAVIAGTVTRIDTGIF